MPLARRALTPSFSDCLLLSLLAWLFLVAPDGWSRLLFDADTGWHIRTGERILATGSVPRTDPYSFSKAGEPWFAWEWGADVIYAFLHERWGLKGIVLLGGLQIGLFAAVLLRHMLWRGANTLLALAVLLLAFGASTLHFLARPHLFTLMLLPVSLWLIAADRTRPSPRVWLLVPLTVVWTNLHGGFLALIACLGLLVAGTFLETLCEDGPRNWLAVRRYTALAAVCSLATLANPYGYHLHVHIANYLQSDWIRNTIQEFQSPSFRSENLLQFELLLLAGLMAAAGALSRRRFTEALWILFWAHQALGSVRHATVFVTVAAPLIAWEATRLWRWFVDGAARSSVRSILDTIARDMVPNFAWTSLWPVLAFLVVPAVETRIIWPKDFPEQTIPVALVEQHKDRIRNARLLTMDQWGDYLIYRFHPEVKVFIDGRSDFYGPSIGNDYVRVTQGHYEWRTILDRYGFTAALVPVEWPLASLLKTDASWRLLTDGGKALYFERVRQAPGAQPGTRSSRRPENLPASLMESSVPSETPMGDYTRMRHGKSAPLSTIPRSDAEQSTPPKNRDAAEAESPRESGSRHAQLWRLPSGQPFSDFVLHGGFVAPLLMKKTGPVVQPAAGREAGPVRPAARQPGGGPVRGGHGDGD